MNAYPPAPDPQQPPYGAPPAAPYGQYGQYGQYQPPSQYPQPPYGQYAPPSQYPQPPYPGAPTAGYAPMGSGAVATPTRRRGPVIGIILAVLAVLLVVGGIVRYNSPAGALRSYIQAYYADDVDGSYALYCPAIQAVFSRDQQASMMSAISQLRSVDLSNLSYVIVNESLTSADVRLDGNFTYTTTSGQTGTWQSADNNTDIFNMQARGIGWCISGVNGQTPVGGQTG